MSVGERHALVCSYYPPRADRDSGSRRMLHFVEFLLEGGWQVSFLASEGIDNPRVARRLEQRGVTVHDGSTQTIEALVSAEDFDLALIAFWSNAERYLPLIREYSPMTRVIVDSVDLHLLRETRRTFHGPSEHDHPNMLDAKVGSRFVRELNAYAAADGVLAVSRKEAGIIGDLVGESWLAHFVPDCEELHASTLPFEARHGILSVGNFEHAPNIEAVEYLLGDILPRVDPGLLDQHPVYIVGNRLGEKVLRAGRGFRNVRMVGWVPFVEPYFAQARVAVAPLLYGAGTKRKMLQALMSGTPSVSTSVGTEGLDLEHGEHVMLGDDPQAFADGISALLTDPAAWNHIARAGRLRVERTHTPDSARRQLLSAIDSVSKRPAKGFSPLGDPGTIDVGTGREEYQRRTLPRIRKVVAELLPKGSSVLVVSKGDTEILKLNRTDASHFPQRDDGTYAGHHPSDDHEAIAHLETLRDQGREFLLFPHTAFWWLEHYDGFRRHLDRRYTQVVDDPETCRIYDLRTVVVRSEPERSQPVTFNRGSDVKLIALYLPQFHPIPENDAWWGEGFTEWRNVARANPLFPGHYQPHIPADLGFYDLRLASTRQAQADLARHYGIHGFCYYHYWFNGSRLLERPFNEVLASGKPDLPFCLCWANDPWSRRWDGREDELLRAQTYSADDDVAHIQWLMPALSDRRAIRIDGKPVFLVYRGLHLPDAAGTTERWRVEVERAGLPGIYLIAVETGWDLGWDATSVGFDAKMLFQPQFGKLMTSVPRVRVPDRDELQVYDYQQAWQVLENLDPVSYTRYDCVFPGWDNTARRGERAVVLHNSSPAAYQRVLERAVVRARTQPGDHRVVFINAWNEWAEGCHLEPDLRYGSAFLEATARALRVRTSAPYRISA